METIKTIALLIITLLAGISAYQWLSRAEYVPPEAVDQMLDENTRVMSAQIRDREAIIASLREDSEAAADRIEELQEEIIAHAQVAGELRIYRDSVQSLQQHLATRDIIKIIEEGRDTTAVFAETFSDSLFQVTSSVRFSPESIENRLDLQQLRPIRMSFTVTEGDQGQVLFYTYLPDFGHTEQAVWSPPPEVKRPWYQRYWKEIAIGGLVAVLAIK